MAISSTDITAGPYTTNGATTSFSFSFRVADYGDVEAEDMVKVVLVTISSGAETILTRGVSAGQYTVTINGDQDSSPGGSITTISTYAAGYYIYVRLKPTFKQATELTNQGAYNASVVEAQFDELQRQILDLRDQLRRVAVAGVQIGESFSGEITGTPTAGYIPQLNSGLTGYEWVANNGSSNLVTATGGSTANTLANRFGWQLHLQDFGAATPDNATDATTTINLANTAGGRIIVPITSAGSIYATSHDDPTQDLLNAVWLGPGRIEINGYAQAPFRSIISAEQTAPASDDRYRFFNEGFPKANRASFMGVYGSSVTPSAGSYTNFPQLAYDVLIYDNTAGFNASTSSHTSGRSGIFASFNRLYHGGQGDLVARHVYLEGYSARASATHWLANPALVVDNGNLGISAAGGAGTYMNHSEFTYSDNGHRAAVIDRVRNYDRDSNTTTLGEVWLHDRPQSTGTYDADCVYSVAGKWKRGLDFTPATLDADKAAVVLKAGDRIYFGSTGAADSSGAVWFADTLGSAYLYGTATDIRSSVAGTDAASLVTVGGTQTLTNKTLTTPAITVLDNALTIQDNSDPTKQAQFQASGITAGQTRVLTLPDADTIIPVISESTWTPVLTCATPGDLAVTYATQLGFYYRIGNLVFVSGFIATSAFTWTTASGAVQITGLPFTSENVTNKRWNGSSTVSGFTSAGYTNFVFQIRPNATLGFIIRSGSGVVTGAASIAEFPTGGTVELVFTCAYRIA